MRVASTKGIVLKVAPYSRTSHVVTWLTPDAGRLTTLVKGACRPKSWFLGQYDLFYTCEILYYTRTRTGLHILKECAPLELRLALRTDWRAAAFASYVCDLLARTSVDGGRDQGLYALAGSILNVASHGGATTACLLWFELTLVRTLGFGPRLLHCSGCGKDVPSGEAAVFCASRGGIVCRACTRAAQTKGIALAADVLAILRAWQRTTTPRSVLNTAYSPEQLIALRQALGVSLVGSLDVPMENRAIALDLLRQER